MVEIQADRRKRRWWPWALLVAFILAIVAWGVSRGYRQAHTEALARDAAAQSAIRGAETAPRPTAP